MCIENFFFFLKLCSAVNHRFYSLDVGSEFAVSHSQRWLSLNPLGGADGDLSLQPSCCLALPCWLLPPVRMKERSFVLEDAHPFHGGLRMDES